jgi:hypothetical protein
MSGISPESEVLEISKEKFQMMKDADVDSLDWLLSPAFTLTHLTGHIGSRLEWLADLKSRRFIYHSIEPKDYSVKSEGAKVVVISRAVFDASIYGGRGRYPLELTESYEKEGGNWKLMKMVARLY